MMSRVKWASSLAIVAIATVGLVAIFVGTQRSPLVVSPSAIDFGEMQVGEERSGVVVITNLGDETVAIDDLQISEPFTGPKVLRLAPGASQALRVRVEPAQSGPLDGEVLIAGPGLGKHRVALSGQVLGHPAMAVAPRFLSFGDVGIGGVAKGLVEVSNHGEVDLEIESIGGRSGFSASPNQLRIAPGQSVSLEVQFSPPARRRFEDTLAIASNDPEQSELWLYLDGSGVAKTPEPELALSPSVIDFGPVPVGAALDRWVTLANLGSDPLTVSTLRAQSPFVTSRRSRTIDAGSEVRLPVSCRPAAGGPMRQPLLILSNDPNSPEASVDLRCTGATGAEALIAAQRPGVRVLRDGEDGPGVELDAEVAQVIHDKGEVHAFAPIFRGDEGGEAIDPFRPDGTDEALDGETLADFDEEPDASEEPFLPPQRIDGGVVTLGTHPADVEHYHLDKVVFDPTSGNLDLEGLQLPTVDGTLGEYFEFAEVPKVAGQFDAWGEFEQTLQLEMTDRNGNTFPFEVTLTTGTASTRTQDGYNVLRNGRGLSSDGTAVLVGVHTFTRGPWTGQPMTMRLEVQL